MPDENEGFTDEGWPGTRLSPSPSSSPVVLASLPRQWRGEADAEWDGARAAVSDDDVMRRERGRTLRACASELAAVLATQPVPFPFYAANPGDRPEATADGES